MTTRFTEHLNRALQRLASPLPDLNHGAESHIQKAREKLQTLPETRDMRQIIIDFGNIGDSLFQAASHVESLADETRAQIEQFQTIGRRSATCRKSQNFLK